jgi:ATP-binding protein involved in chromosome partitioning
MPPGTGDVAISIGQLLPRAEAVIVTTPQPAAQQVAVRAAVMAQKLGMRVVGVVENMSWLVGSGQELFGAGGGDALAAEIDAPVLARIPFDPALREAADAGRPVLEAAPASEASEAIRSLAEAIQSRRQGQIRKALTVL